ncbi:MAG: ABC transporter permease [Chloroflexota bacterium]|jgi:peptide/nickel transport system permease protein
MKMIETSPSTHTARVPGTLARKEATSLHRLGLGEKLPETRSGWRRFTRDPIAIFAFATLLVLAIAALLAPIITPYDPSRINLAKTVQPPGADHLLGTDLLGRDLFARSLYGARISLAVGVSSAAIAAILGLALGLVAAYRSGWIDVVVTRLVDASLAMPALFVLIAVQSILGPSVINVVLMVSLVGWMLIARAVRALTLSLKEREFILAARALGCSGSRIVLRHLLPNLAGQVIVLFALGIADALLIESALSFLGMGIPASVPSWGNMLSDAQTAILSGAWWVAVVPGALILWAALAINLLGDGLQEVML